MRCLLGDICNNKAAIGDVLFYFDGFLRQGVGDPRQAQLAVRLTF